MENDLQPPPLTGFQRLYAPSGRGWWVLGFLIFYLFVQALFSYPAFVYRDTSEDRGLLNCRGIAMPDVPDLSNTKTYPVCNILDLQLAFSPIRFKAILLRWDEIAVFKKSVRQIDFIFPVAYAGLLALLYAWSRGNKTPRWWDWLLFGLPVFAAACDFMENLLHLRLLSGLDTPAQVEAAAFSAMTVFTASSFAMLKLITGFVIMPLAILAAWIMRIYRFMHPWSQFKPRMQEALRRVFSVLPYVYLLRFPALTAIGLIGLAYLSFFTGARSLLENLFDLQAAGIFWVSLVAFLIAWAVMASSRLILLYGSPRFKVAPLGVKQTFNRWYLVRHGLLAVPLTISAVLFARQNVSGGLPVAALMAVLGLLASLGAVWVSTWIQRRLTPPESALSQVDLLVPSTVSAQQSFKSAGETPMPRWGDWVMRKLQRLFKPLGAGYVDRRSGEILTGHVMALSLFAITVLVYGLVGGTKAFLLGASFNIPALAYVLWLFLLFCWGMTALSFFLDRHRLPVLIPILVWLILTAQLPQADHIYELQALPAQAISSQPAAPVEVLQAKMQSTSPEPKNAIIVVAASGGGIQAAGWTAQVLAGLERDRPGQFGRLIRLISAVSGGSVGAMYFANTYQNGALEPQRLESAINQSMHSSLDEIAWGLVYPDFLRTLCPFCFGSMDRGQALELALTRADQMTASTLDRATLAGWRSDVERGHRPAVIFNTTITDTGERLLLATSLPAKSSQQADPAAGLSDVRGSRSFSDIYGDRDLKIVTAARLSAAFPYASPAARANLSGPQYHVVDGGYYDNYGISSLAQWLDEALYDGCGINQVLVVQIRAFPVGDDERQPRKQPATQRGWFYQAFAPVSTLMNVRTAGQFAHNQVEFDLLQKVLKSRNIDLINAEFEFQSQPPNNPPASCEGVRQRYTPPLSWHLTTQQKNAVRQEWERFIRCGKLEPVRRFLDGVYAASAAGNQ
jgi:hypothetical protein